MSYCSGCGTEVGPEVAFCPKCGRPAGAPAAGMPASGPPPSAAATGMDQNAAALLSYVLGWLTGLIFFLIDKRPYVRFHAMQSMITFGVLHVIQIVLVWGGLIGGTMGGMMGGFGFGGAWILYGLLSLLILVLWIICMVKAYQGQRFKVPIAGNLAENWSR